MSYTIEELAVKYAKGTLDPSECTKTELALLIMYMNDKNSSTLRQMVMCNIAGVQSNPNKLGFDGLDTVQEMKPKNISSDGGNKLTMGGNYSDMTIPRHNKFLEDNAVIHVGGFIDGKLIFQIEVSYSSLAEHFMAQLNKYFPNGHEVSKYLRSMTFSQKQIQQLCNPRVLFVTDNLDSYRGFITKPLYNYLRHLLDER